jgi:gliding motility-associated-like protein
MLKPYDVSNIHLTIFNRWGVKVFETNDPNAGWDGRFKGVTQGPGIYVWFCTYTKGDRNTKQKGTFMLLR